MGGSLELSNLGIGNPGALTGNHILDIFGDDPGDTRAEIKPCCVCALLRKVQGDVDQ